MAKNAAAALAEDVPAGLMNFAADPGGTLLHPLVVAGGTAYDAAAPYLGLPRMSPDLRSALYDQPPPGQTQAPTDQPIGTRVMNAVDAAVLPPDRSATTLPATPDEAMVRRGVGAAATVATMGPGGLLAPAVAGVSAAVAPEIAKTAPDWAQPGVELAVNTIPQIVTGGIASRAGPTDAADAATMQLARDKFDIPLNATDITPGSGYRTPASMQASVDGLQRNIVSEMGEDPNTSDLLSRNKITTGPGGVMDRTATRVGGVFDDVANRTNVNPAETNNVITKLANIDGGLDLENLTDAQKALIRRNIDLVQNAAANGNGTISGADYQGLTRTGTPLDKLASNSDPTLAAIGMQIKSALDDGFQASASPADQAALTQARYQWRLMKTVQRLAEKAQGANIDPGDFASRVVPRHAQAGRIDRRHRLYRRRCDRRTQPHRGRHRSRADTGFAFFDRRYIAPSRWRPVAGYMIDPKLERIAHGLQVVRNQLAGPYLRSGINAQNVINNALYRPSLLGGSLQGGVGGVASNRLMPPAP